MMSPRAKRMVMTVERAPGDDIYPTGYPRVVDIRPANRRERIAMWFRGLFKKTEPDRADFAGLGLPIGAGISVGIELSAETYSKLVSGNTKIVEAVDMLRDVPISMSLVVAPESIPEPSLEEMQETVV
jgi:hypothetical protein